MILCPKVPKGHNYHVYPRDSIISAGKDFINIDNAGLGETRSTCFYVEDNKSCYFNSFRRQPDNFLLNQLSKPKIFRKQKIRVLYSRLCGMFCLYFL